MLRTLFIRNLAVIEELELEFDPGMTVLTGETGAGKSILIDSLGLVLGDRADSDKVRPGARQAEINAVFTYHQDDDAHTWLQEHELEDDSSDECLLRRSISAEGRSKAYINGTPVPLHMLRDLGALLIDIHGQHAHQSLLQRPVQLQLLDAFAGHQQLVAQVGAAYRQWKQLRDELRALRDAEQQRSDQQELLRYQVQELEVLGLADDEVAQLEEEHQRLANITRLATTCNQAVNDLEQDEQRPITSHLAQLANELRQLQQFDQQLAAITELLDGATVQLQEAATELRRYLDRLDSDPQRLAGVEQRLSAIYDLARKHHVEPAQLTTHYQQLKTQLEELEAAGQRGDELEAQFNAARGTYDELATTLSEQRHASAAELDTRVTEAITTLGIPEGHFTVDIQPFGGGQPAESGMERVEFHIATGAGLPPRPLSKVASGGELSRISLAIEAITAQQDGAATLIFDEVDVGIGGKVAEIVGQHLRQLAAHHQIICVTHLPQVAALTHHHFQVSKHARDGATTAAVRRLSDDERHEELARMLGGIEITEQTRAHAREMLHRANNHT